MAGLPLFILIIIAFLLAGAMGWLVTMFNSLIQVKNTLNKAWTNIDVLLLQRNEELPRLIDLSKASLKYEQDVLQSLASLRNAYGNARSVIAKINIENQVRERMAALITIGESCPDLKANALFQIIQTRMADLEASIADRRIFFNDTANIYNTRIEQAPQRCVAWLLRYKPHPLLKLTPGGKR